MNINKILKIGIEPQNTKVNNHFQNKKVIPKAIFKIMPIMITTITMKNIMKKINNFKINKNRMN